MQPTPKEQVYNLLRLSQNKEAELPGSNYERDKLTLRLIYEAQQKGATWAEIGLAVMGQRDGKLAKKYAKRLAGQTQKEMLRRGDTG